MPIFPSKSLEAINYSINYGIGLDSTALSVKKRELPQHGCRCLEYVTDQEGKAIDSSPLFPLLPASMSLPLSHLQLWSLVCSEFLTIAIVIGWQWTGPKNQVACFIILDVLTF